MHVEWRQVPKIGLKSLAWTTPIVLVEWNLTEGATKSSAIASIKDSLKKGVLLLLERHGLVSQSRTCRRFSLSAAKTSVREARP
jgi:hypothetical protein